MTKATIRKFGQALQPQDAPAPDMVARIRSRFAELGDVRLELAQREAVRDVAEQPALRPAQPPTRSR